MEQSHVHFTKLKIELFSSSFFFLSANNSFFIILLNFTTIFFFTLNYTFLRFLLRCDTMQGKTNKQRNKKPLIWTTARNQKMLRFSFSETSSSLSGPAASSSFCWWLEWKAAALCAHQAPLNMSAIGVFGIMSKKVTRIGCERCCQWHCPGLSMQWVRIDKIYKALVYWEKRGGKREKEEERYLLTSVNIWSKWKNNFAISQHIKPMLDVVCLIFICQTQQILLGWNLAILKVFQ